MGPMSTPWSRRKVITNRPSRRISQIIRRHSGSLAQAVPRNIAFEILFTGEFIGAQRALELMLVNHVVPPDEVMPRAEEMARKITANAPLSIAAIKDASVNGAAMDLERRGASAPTPGARPGHARWIPAVGRVDEN